MAIRLVVSFNIHPGKAKDFAAAFKPQQEITHKEKGCEQYELFQSLDGPDTLVLLERWTTAEDLEEHMKAMQARGGSSTAQFSAGPPTVERFEVD